ncbi:MAG: PAC2 family protein [Candidatus Bathyarchaeota archaeon]|nr:PAC2 family protein [Candidatus Bathyarchaeota archaeon]
MDTPYLRETANPNLETPIFIQGLPGFGNVGKITAQLLIKYTDAKPFAQLYSPTFPDYVIVNSKGTCRLPHYAFYSTTIDDTNFVIMTGETQPSFDDVLAQYAVCGEIVNYVKTLNCQFLITIGGVPLTEDKAQIYVAATSKKLAEDFTSKGAAVYSRGRIVGGTGLTLALAKEQGLRGVCLLGATTGFKTDKNAGSLAFKFLMKALGKEIKEALPETL